MKFLLFLVAVFLLLWLLRGTARRVRPPRPPSPPPKTLPMATCQQCGVHLPRDEALPGKGGVFCGEAHRAAYEKAHPDA